MLNEYSYFTVSPPTSWAASPLCQELGSINYWPVGTVSGQGLQARVDGTTISEVPLTGGRRGSAEVAGQEGNMTDGQPMPQPVYQQDIPIPRVYSGQ